MKIFRDFDEVHSIRNAVVTTGSFDGVHIAHKIILERLKKLANDIGGETVVITFHPHPAKVLYPETAGRELRLINSEEEKIELLTMAGLDNLIIVNFTLEFSKITSTEFVRNWLVEKLNTRKIVIGFNHHFGHNREGDYEKLRLMGLEYGFDVEEIPEQEIQDETVSSGVIRQALKDGDIEKANAYLDHNYLIIGQTTPMRDRINDPDFPGFFVTIEEKNKLLPSPGVYAVRILDEDHAFHGVCMVDSGSAVDPLQAGIYLFDNRYLFSGKKAIILFHKRIRDNDLPLTGNDLSVRLQSDKILVESLPSIKFSGT